MLGTDGTLYEKSRYIACFQGPDGTPAPSPEPTQTASASVDPDATPDTSPRVPTALTPNGQGTTVDNVTSKDDKEFYTIQTPDENTFYLVIDKQRDQQNVYFLNAVTESDLMALAEKTAPEGAGTAGVAATPEPEPVCTCKNKCELGAVDTACPVCVLSMSGCKGVAVASTGNEDPKTPPQKSGMGTTALILLVALAAGGAGWYFKIYKPKHDLDNAEDFDELTGAAEEKTVNEDEEPEPEPQPRPRPVSRVRPSYEADEPGEQIAPPRREELREPVYSGEPQDYDDEPEEPEDQEEPEDY